MQNVLLDGNTLACDRTNKAGGLSKGFTLLAIFPKALRNALDGVAVLKEAGYQHADVVEQGQHRMGLGGDEALTQDLRAVETERDFEYHRIAKEILEGHVAGDLEATVGKLLAGHFYCLGYG